MCLPPPLPPIPLCLISLLSHNAPRQRGETGASHQFVPHYISGLRQPSRACSSVAMCSRLLLIIPALSRQLTTGREGALIIILPNASNGFGLRQCIQFGVVPFECIWGDKFEDY